MLHCFSQTCEQFGCEIEDVICPGTSKKKDDDDLEAGQRLTSPQTVTTTAPSWALLPSLLDELSLGAQSVGVPIQALAKSKQKIAAAWRSSSGGGSGAAASSPSAAGASPQPPPARGGSDPGQAQSLHWWHVAQVSDTYLQPHHSAEPQPHPASWQRPLGPGGAQQLQQLRQDDQRVRMHQPGHVAAAVAGSAVTFGAAGAGELAAGVLHGPAELSHVVQRDVEAPHGFAWSEASLYQSQPQLGPQQQHKQQVAVQQQSYGQQQQQQPVYQQHYFQQQQQYQQPQQPMILQQQQVPLYGDAQQQERQWQQFQQQPRQQQQQQQPSRPVRQASILDGTDAAPAVAHASQAAALSMAAFPLQGPAGADGQAPCQASPADGQRQQDSASEPQQQQVPQQHEQEQHVADGWPADPPAAMSDSATSGASPEPAAGQPSAEGGPNAEAAAQARQLLAEANLVLSGGRRTPPQWGQPLAAVASDPMRPVTPPRLQSGLQPSPPPHQQQQQQQPSGMQLAGRVQQQQQRQQQLMVGSSPGLVHRTPSGFHERQRQAAAQRHRSPLLMESKGVSQLPQQQQQQQQQPQVDPQLQQQQQPYLQPQVQQQQQQEHPQHQQPQEGAPGAADSQQLPSSWPPSGGLLGSVVAGKEVPFSELQLGALIGEGGFGKVYFGRHHGQPVAIKVLSWQQHSAPLVVPIHPHQQQHQQQQQGAPPQKLLQEFRREVLTMLSLPPHPNILKLVAVCTVAPLALVTEFCANGSLYGLLHSPTAELSWVQVARILKEAAMGMAHLHNHSVLHRDLKSANLLLDERMSARVADFGLSRLHSGGLTTMTGGLGTFQWMAPEVLANQRYSSKADVYSFGVVVWECTSRQVPYDGMNGVQAAMAVVNRGLRPEIPSHTPASLAELIRACWAPIPEQRPNFDQVVVWLGDILAALEQPQQASQAPPAVAAADGAVTGTAAAAAASGAAPAASGPAAVGQQQPQGPGPQLV